MLEPKSGLSNPPETSFCPLLHVADAVPVSGSGPIVVLYDFLFGPSPSRQYAYAVSVDAVPL
jgi:hypothetical protein